MNPPTQSESQEAALPNDAGGASPAMLSHQRLIDRPARSQFEPEAVLAPHRRRTLKRLQGQDAVLCLPTETELKFAEDPYGWGIGLMAKHAPSEDALVTLRMHSTVAVAGNGMPLGVPQIRFDTAERRAEPKIERWTRGLRECAVLAELLDGVRPLAVIDCDVDPCALFAEQRRLRAIDLLARVTRSRIPTREARTAFDEVRAAPAGAALEIYLERPWARAAQLELRWQTVRLPTAGAGTYSVPLQVVHVREGTPPKGGTRLEWFLLTSSPVRSQGDAERILRYYRLSGWVGDWQRVLRVGCTVARLRCQWAEAVDLAVTANAVIAWRLTAMIQLGQAKPGPPPEFLFSDLELHALQDFAKASRLPAPENLRQAVLTMAAWGGSLKRNRLPSPGSLNIWNGYLRLEPAEELYCRGGL